MNTKVFALTFICLFAAQGIVQARHVPLTPEQKSIVDDALAALEELKQIVRGAIDDAKAEIQALIDEAKALADGVIASGSAELQAEVDKVLAEIEVLKQQAAAVGQTIEGCIGTQEEAIKQLPLLLATELYHCVTDQLNEAIIIISGIVADIETTWAAVTGLDEDFTACDGDWICLGEVAAECAIKVVSLPIEIGEQVIKASDFISTIKSDLQECAVAKVAQIALEAGGILGNIAECVANQLG